MECSRKAFQVHQSHLFNDKRQTWLQQLAEGPLHRVHVFDGYKVHRLRFHTLSRSKNKKTRCSGILVRGIGEGNASGADFFGQLEEVIEVEYPGEPIKHCILFLCDWFDPTIPRGTRYSKLNCTYEVNFHRRYNKYDPFILADVAYQVVYLPYPQGVPDKSNWWATFPNKPRKCPQQKDEGPSIALAF